MKTYDLIVVGGGFAGCAAAISAARAGASVLLLEKSNALGGAAVNSLVHPFMPNATRVNGQMLALSQGIFQEICAQLPGGKLTLSEETRPLKGGFILSDGKVEVNCSFDTLVRLQKTETAGEVAKRLFSEI